MVPGNSKVTERMAVLAALLPQDNGTNPATLTGTGVNIAGTNGQFFSRYLIAALVNDTNKVTVTVVKASDSAMTGATAITGLSQTNNSTATPVILFDVNATTQALNDTLNTFIAPRIVTTSNGQVIGAALTIGADGRFDPSVYWNGSQVNTTINSV